MHIRIDPQLADRIAETTISSLRPTRNKILCTREDATQAILSAIEEAHEIGYLAGHADWYAEAFKPGYPDRPAWMNIHLDEANLARYQLRLTPIVFRSLASAGYHCLGDLRSVPERKLAKLRYIGFKTARKLMAMIRTFEATDTPGPTSSS